MRPTGTVSPPSRKIVVAALTAVVAGAVLPALVVGATRTNEMSVANREARYGEAPPFRAPSFRYRDQAGREVSSDSLAGTPYVANFIFTSCKTACPSLTARMVQVQRSIPSAHLRFVSFSVDPAHDTAEALASYARQWAPRESRWALARTDEASVRELAAGFHVSLNSAPSGGADAILHSNMLLLVDAQGVVRGMYDAFQVSDIDALGRHARRLADGTTGAPSPTHSPTDAAVLYRDLGCAGCHTRSDLAPPLGGLLGRRRTFTNGASLDADRGYIRESILRPDAQKVTGYPLRMPGYDGLLADAEVEALVSWIAVAGGDDAPIHVVAAVATDPVCHMEVRVTPDSPTATHGGASHWFCSETCRDRFLRAPADYPGGFSNAHVGQEAIR